MNNKKASKDSIIDVFDRIAQSYDKFDAILSFWCGLHWRKKLKNYLPKKPNLLLVDLATGTCNQILALSDNKHIDKFIGFDLSEKMLTIGLKKIIAAKITNKVDLRLGNILKIPFSDNRADCVTISFGIRYTDDYKRCLMEAFRILKCNGRIIILESTKPKLALQLCKYIYKNFDAYYHLNKNIDEFQSCDNFIKLMHEVGLQKVKRILIGFGIGSIYIGDKIAQ